MNISNEIKLRAEEISDDLIAIRRHLHANPELSFQEENTSAYISGKLDKLSIPYTTGWAGYGIVGIIEGTKGPSQKMVGIRADMDALPITEANEIDYASKNHGVMHACGHDVHSTCLLGAARILSERKAEFSGKVMLIFQPGEEKLPGGASIMIEEGLFDKYKPDCLFGLHVHPPLEVGKVGIKSGLYMASADEIYITVNGKGGHGALPQNCIDPIVISAKIISALQEIVSRYSNPAMPTVLTLGKINSVGGATNIIPNKVKIEGTFRTMDEVWRKEAHRLIEQMVTDTAKANGATADIEIKIGYPCLVNDEAVAKKTKAWMQNFLGEDQVVDLPLRMTSEDFSFYTHHVPSCFYRLGTGNASKGIISPVHTDSFNVDEQALVVGSGLMAHLALESLKTH